MAKILVTGGSGYIGGHTITDLADNGFEVISVDNFSNGSPRMLEGISKVIHKNIKNYDVDLCDTEATRQIFEENKDIAGIIHFAAFKSVPESVAQPLKYYRNNLDSLLNVLEFAKEYNIRHFVFSSSCSVYGNAEKLPVDENAPLLEPESPYARTKQIGEDICRDFAKEFKDINITLLRYFNPVGAHPSALIGEFNAMAESVVPVITQTAIGLRKEMSVFGDDYNTRDGSCIRDYIHVMDIASAHTKALQHTMAGKNESNCEVYNLGTGDGVTVLELIHSFEKVSSEKLNYKIVGRRPGDIIEIYANNDKARNALGWDIKFDLDMMMDTAWRWQQALNNNK